MFILPPEGKYEKWFESESSCTAEYVQIEFDASKATAVKITRITKLNDGNEVKDWEYWLPNYGKIASFGQWGKGAKVWIGEVSNIIDDPTSIKEITKSLDLSYEEPRRKSPIRKR